MLGQGRTDDVRDGDGAEAGLALGRPPLRYPVPDGDQLAADAGGAAQEVDPVDGEAEALALAHAHAGGEDDQGMNAVGDGGGEGLHIADAEGHHLGVGPLGQGDADAR